MRIRRDPHVFIAAALSAALAVSLADGAWAQQATNNSGAGNNNGGGMQQIQRQGDIEFVSGGVGADESHALERARSQWPLGLSFTGSGLDYVADVQVRIVDPHNANVLNATSQGPYMLVRLRPGRYTVHASYKGNEQSKAVTVPAKGSARLTFDWASQ
ncbi:MULTISPECIES: carboxypeptidase-like regulatory domain-containing protein [Paraburkholderia]|uniref:Carboxypeptidase regulatory-like domain-containing protein n=1 Tax=Paraburkholderia hospita TaxID=169430 RepID=A0AAJ4VXV3_9BURK|nr:carboxypeptidase-like regulatory domain-containing protein [Paraburkholderia hospita]AUT69099.1 carboxypeptidase regulatory-like domain-containing protein [Paraburkholderia hospita]AXE99232.1 carboxypeptidase regulatory-like domain-containing protein [Paraburkholderia hospita]EIN02335.1 hypothetical protein WQE_04462 [Paraburkholderia hospita]OUL73876.1 hypothetical protein CA601_43360 [Paraburkholderia hospita]OUL93281.1 hypothetical protein CA602_01400 [Paraburkholderia hospita]